MKYFLFVFLLVSQISFGQQAPEAGKPSGPGCYSKCLIPDQYEFYTTQIFEYIGDNYNDPNIEYASIEVKEPSSKWVRKKANKNCLSINPEDCLVWCLVEYNAEYYDFYEVLDTSLTKQFMVTEIESSELVTHGGNTEWKEVLGDYYITPQIYQDLRTALVLNGYSIGDEIYDIEGFGSKAKAAFIKFQKDNSLPVGQ